MTVRVYGQSEIEALSREVQGLRGGSGQEPPSLLEMRQSVSRRMGGLRRGSLVAILLPQACSCPAKRTVTGMGPRGSTTEGRFHPGHGGMDPPKEIAPIPEARQDRRRTDRYGDPSRLVLRTA